MQKGKASLSFEQAPVIWEAASIVGEKEGSGPLATCFDRVEADPMCGQKTWEAAESELQKQAAIRVLEKAEIGKGEIRYLFAGDLLGQSVATSFGVMELEIPLFGLYGACSTMGEAMMLAAMTVNAGYADKVMALASSHFASAERQFRFPSAYGNQRPLSTTWTVTGCGAVIIGETVDRTMNGDRTLGEAKITGVTTGKIVDMKVRDAMNMGAAMAVPAVDTILQNFRDFGVDETAYDKIITGDLGTVGQTILLDFMREAGHDVKENHLDCGIEIFDPETQDTHSGGSGCGCAAVTFCGYVLPKIRSGEWKKVLFVPTGALLSQVSFNEGQSVPGIAHAVVVEHTE
ncbi:MAG: stage V sporulation protein AD [Clostridium sp.]